LITFLFTTNPASGVCLSDDINITLKILYTILPHLSAKGALCIVPPESSQNKERIITNLSRKCNLYILLN